MCAGHLPIALSINCQDSLLKAPDPAPATLSLERVCNRLLHTRTQHSDLELRLCAEILFLACALLIIQLVERGCAYPCPSPWTAAPCEGPHPFPRTNSAPSSPKRSRVQVCDHITMNIMKFTAQSKACVPSNPYVEALPPNATTLRWCLGGGNKG